MLLVSIELLACCSGEENLIFSVKKDVKALDCIECKDLYGDTAGLVIYSGLGLRTSRSLGA